MTSRKKNSNNQEKYPENPLVSAYNNLLTDWAREITDNNRVHVVCHDKIAERGTHGYIRKEKMVFFEPGLYIDSNQPNGRESSSYEASVDKFVVQFLKTLATRDALYNLNEPKMYSEKGFKVLDHTSKTETRMKYDAIAENVTNSIQESAGYKRWQKKVSGYVTAGEYHNAPEFREHREKQDEPIKEEVFDGLPYVFVGTPSPEELIAGSEKWTRTFEEAVHRATEADAIANKYDKIYQLAPDMVVVASIRIDVEQRGNIKKAIEDLAADRDLAQNIKEEIMAVHDAVYLSDEYKSYIDALKNSIAFDFTDNVRNCFEVAHEEGMDVALLTKNMAKASKNNTLGEFAVNLINMVHADDGSDLLEKRISMGPKRF